MTNLMLRLYLICFELLLIVAFTAVWLGAVWISVHPGVNDSWMWTLSIGYMALFGWTVPVVGIFRLFEELK